ncbi:MAG: YraN family protein [bacterium]|nr:YraN family protein [bacterium]
MTDKRIAGHRSSLGAFGETMAASFLERNGARVIARNVAVGRGEIDLMADEGEGLFVVEVKTATESDDDHPRWNFTDRKADQVARLARSMGVRRVDLVTVVVGANGLDLEWHRRVA